MSVNSYGMHRVEITYFQDRWPSQAIITSESQFVLFVVRGGQASLGEEIIQIIRRVEGFNQGLAEFNETKERLMLRGVFFDNVKGNTLELHLDYLFDSDVPGTPEEEIHSHLEHDYGPGNTHAYANLQFKKVNFSSDHFYNIHDDFYGSDLRKSIYWKD